MLAEAARGIGSATSIGAHTRNVRIGGVSLALDGDWHEQLHLGRDLEDFQIESDACDIAVKLEWSETLSRLSDETIFDSGAVWTVSRDASDFVFDFTSSAVGRCPYKRLRADATFRTAQLILNRQALRNYGPICPLEYPTDELLITNFLASAGAGVEVHGCGLVDSRAGGQLFLGHSGAGKSTTTRVWETFREVQVLSDDRIILRFQGGELWMYGTPWHGEAAFASPGKAKIDRIFILQQGERNKMRGLPKAQAVGEVFARCFPPFHSAAGLEGALEFIHRALEVVPCYEFQFVPDQSAVKAVLEFHD